MSFSGASSVLFLPFLGKLTGRRRGYFLLPFPMLFEDKGVCPVTECFLKSAFFGKFSGKHKRMEVVKYAGVARI